MASRPAAQPTPKTSIQDTTIKEESPKPSIPVWLFILFLLLISIIVGMGIYIGFQNNLFSSKQTRLTPTPSPSEETGARTLRQTMKPDATWLTYRDADAGFTLKYPPTVTFNSDGDEPEPTALHVIVEKLTDIPEEMPLGMDRKTATADKDALASGKAQTIGDFVSSDALVPLTGGAGAPQLRLNARMNSVLSRFEICSVLFERSLTFYPGEYRVRINLVGNAQRITTDMPDFFTRDSKNCGEQTMWVRSVDKMGAFLPTLAQGEGKGAGQEWYDTFDGIIQTIVLNPSGAGTVPASLSPMPTATPACDVSDSAFCNVLNDIKQSMDTNNYNGVIAYQTTTTVTCDPDGMFVAICEGVPKGMVREGYAIGYKESEGTIQTREAHLAIIASYLNNNGPFQYKGSLQQGDKGVIVYLNQDQSYLLVLYMKRTGLTWRFDTILVGGVFGDVRYTNLDPSLLVW